MTSPSQPAGPDAETTVAEATAPATPNNDANIGATSPRAAARRRLIGNAFTTCCFLATWFGVLVLAVLLVGVFVQAIPFLDTDFFTNFDSQRKPEKAGVLAGLWGSFWLITMTIVLSVPIGVGAALYLEEYARPTKLTRIIQINLSNLAGVPSIVYGILGLTVFVRMFDAFPQGSRLATPLGAIPLPFGPTVISGALTLSLLILPVIIVASQEALRAVPGSIRHASIALGASRWQTTSRQVLPAAVPGILTGVILAVSRAVGETAPLIMVGIPLFIWATPGDITHPKQIFTEPGSLLEVPFGDFTVMPYLIYGWARQAKPEFFGVAAAAILVLLIVLLALNSLAILIRNRFARHAKW